MKIDKYILAHHDRCEWAKKCFVVKMNNETYPFCARCIGILLGILIFCLFRSILEQNYIIVVCPIFAIIDWILYNFKQIHIHKLVNFLTGICLGVYIPFLYISSFYLNYYVILSGLVYCLIGIILLKYKITNPNIS